MRRWLLAIACALTVTAAQAAPPGTQDPDWPCMQIKVPALSVASVWGGPSVDTYVATWSADPEIADLAGRLMQRRLSLDEAKADIANFAQKAGAQKQPKLLALFAGVFDEANRERGSVLAGLDRFGRRQKELAASIRAENDKLQTMQSAAADDEKQVGEQQNRLTWDLQVFQDRRQSISYACEAPNLIEQRLFSLSRAIQAALQPAG
jgi:hypothetical protein